MHDNLGDRMKKNYENRTRFKLNRRTPVIMRLDGKAFHTLTRNHCTKPFDRNFHNAMVLTAQDVMHQIQGAKLAYIQSDEISILITDFDRLETEAWFDYNIQKMSSVAAATASVHFNNYFISEVATFDCRVFNIPKEEVCNYFIWRQNDWVRNSLQMYTRSFYSHKECHKKGHEAMHEMLFAKGVNWADLDAKWKNGTTVYKEDRAFIENPYIQFKLHKSYINRYIYLE